MASIIPFHYFGNAGTAGASMGALLGGFVGRAMGFYGSAQTAGWLMSIGGAILLLVLYRVVAPRRA